MTTDPTCQIDSSSSMHALAPRGSDSEFHRSSILLTLRRDPSGSPTGLDAFTVKNCRRKLHGSVGQARKSVDSNPTIDAKGTKMHHRGRGIALIETVIVILILGIVAAVAAPRMFDPSVGADQRVTLHQLKVLREAIAIYHAKSDVYPSVNELPRSIESMLNGPFPAPRVGPIRGDVGVYYDTDPNPHTAVLANPIAPGGWAYKPANGSLKLNLAPGESGADW